jgi:hypothetical protein
VVTPKRETKITATAVNFAALFLDKLNIFHQFSIHERTLI